VVISMDYGLGLFLYLSVFNFCPFVISRIIANVIVILDAKRGTFL
jgi:hypothetical protein